MRMRSGGRFLGITMATALLLGGCANQQQIGALAGGAVGAGLCKLIFKRTCSAKELAMATGISVMAGTLIGKHLDDRDRKQAEEAAQAALAAREAAVQNALARRNAEIEQQLRAELAAARTEAERARAREQAAQAQLVAAQTATAQATPPVPWTGNGVNGSAQALGPVQVAGRSDCQKVREIAYIGGKEVRQEATFCGGTRVA